MAIDAKEKSFNIYDANPQIHYASPVLKILWMILLLAIRDKSKVITFSRKRGKRDMVVKLDNEHDMVPPPRHLFSRIVNVLRQIGRDATKNPQSSFQFTYTETGQEQKFDWFINHDTTNDLNAELNKLMQKVLDVEELDRKEWHEKQKRRTRRKRWGIGGLIVLVVIAITTAFFLML